MDNIPNELIELILDKITFCNNKNYFIAITCKEWYKYIQNKLKSCINVKFYGNIICKYHTDIKKLEEKLLYENFV